MAKIYMNMDIQHGKLSYIIEKDWVVIKRLLDIKNKMEELTIVEDTPYLIMQYFMCGL